MAHTHLSLSKMEKSQCSSSRSPSAPPRSSPVRYRGRAYQYVPDGGIVLKGYDKESAEFIRSLLAKGVRCWN